MRLTEVKIKNFRSFNEEETTIKFNELTTFIGDNSTGKTTAVQALLKIFGDKNRNMIRSDFHLPSDKNPAEMEQCELYIEAVFDFPKLNQDGETDYSIPIFFNHFIVEDVGEDPYLRIRLESKWEKGNTIEGTIDTSIYFITTPENKNIDEKYKKIAKNSDLSNIKCLYVPATRNPNEQLKMASGTILYRVLNGINWSEGTTEEVNKKIDELNTSLYEEKGFETVKNFIQSNWNKYHNENRYDKALLTFGNSEINELLKSISVKFSPTESGRDYEVNELGDGLRSLFYFSLVNSLLEIENDILMNDEKENEDFNFNPPILTIVAVEEPENHISPHLLGKVVNKLTDISDLGNAQTILTSHSPAIVKRIDSTNIRHFRISEETSTIVNNIKLPSILSDSYKFVKGAVEAYPELYFSKLVVLGEGDSEEFAIKKIFDNKNLNIDSEGISIVPLGGRHVNHFWKLLNDLAIPHITLLDFDRERHGGGWGRIKYAIEQLIANGSSRDELLRLKNGDVLSKEKFNNMDKWLYNDSDSLNNMITRLEKYNVFYSFPLDLDFMLLESFKEEYIESLAPNEGPRLKIDDKNINISEITDSDKLSSEYHKRLNSDKKATLKESGGEGDTYDDNQKELMLWYNYFFLSKSKPITHFRALENIDPEIMLGRIPEPLERLFIKIEKKIKKDLTDEEFLDFLN